MAIYSGFSHWKLWFYIVMLVYQRVSERYGSLLGLSGNMWWSSCLGESVVIIRTKVFRLRQITTAVELYDADSIRLPPARLYDVLPNKIAQTNDGDDGTAMKPQDPEHGMWLIGNNWLPAAWKELGLQDKNMGCIADLS